MPVATAEQRTLFKAEHASAGASDAPRIMQTANGVAEIAVSGVLTKSPNFMMWLFGIANTAYTDIINSLAKASADSTVTSVVLRVDSPGGTVDHLFETLAAIQSFKAAGQKPISVVATQACSAAYAISAVAGSIVATSPSASFGSIGVAASFAIDEDTVDLTSTEAPEKRPDVSTEQGRAVVIRYLDAVHALFAEAIADGRGTKPETVNAEFGRGSVLLAGDALSKRMIDGIAGQKLRSVKGTKNASAESGGTGDHMDLKTLKAQHADVYEAAVADGTKAERDRVSAHLTLAAHGGEAGMKIALAAIEAGDGLTMKVQSQYISLGMNAQSVKTRQEESNEAAAATAGAAGVATADAAVTAPKKDIGDLVADRIAPLAQKAG